MRFWFVWLQDFRGASRNSRQEFGTPRKHFCSSSIFVNKAALLKKNKKKHNVSRETGHFRINDFTSRFAELRESKDKFVGSTATYVAVHDMAERR